MSTTCFIPILGKRLRATTLDECGNVPAAGTAGSSVVTDGFITLTLSSEVEDGSEIITKKADGSLCVNEKLAPSFKRFTVEITFCGVNPSLLAIVSNAEEYEDYNEDVSGFTVGEGEINKKFALELWTGLSGEACAPGATFHGGYVLLPFIQAGVPGDIAVDGENAVTFSMTGAYTKGGNQWDTGPYYVLEDDTSTPALLPTALDELDHLLLIETTLAPPASSCDPLPIPPYITSIVPATGPEAGSTATVITGSGFTGATEVDFGATPGTSFSVDSDSQISVTSPAGTGTVDITVVNATYGNATLSSGFIYT